MTKDDALKQARDTLKNLPGFLSDVETAIDACDEALAQPEQPDHLTDGGKAMTAQVAEILDRLEVFVGGLGKAIFGELRTALAQPPLPEQEPQDIAALVEGMEVSIDVSTGDHDAGHRLFGTVTLAQQNQGGKHGLILLVQDPEPNFKTAATPPLPVQNIEYCTDYHCARDCGQPHNQKEMQEFLYHAPPQRP